MAFWDRFRKTFRYGAASLIPWMEAPENYNLDNYLRAYGQVYSLFGIALRIATGVGEVRWRLFKGSDRSERSQIPQNAILDLLDYCNEFQTGQEVIELTQLHIDLAGRAYWYLAYNGLGVPSEIWVLPPNKVKIVPSEKEFIAGYTYTSGTETIPLEKREIIRFTMPDPINPYGAIGYVQPAVVEIDSENYAGKWNRNFFFNSARADAVLEYEDKLTDEEFERLREQWKSKYQGLSRAHKIAILEGGVKYKQIQIAQKDMDFAELRKQTRENLLFTFGMPLSVMGISENVNRANAEAGDYTFARWLVKPRLVRIRNKLNEQLITKFSKAQGVELDFDEVVPETVEQKKELAESGVKAGWMTINEGRKLNGLDSTPNGDVFLIPFNMMPTPADKPIEVQPIEPRGKSMFGSEVQKETFWKMYVAKAETYEKLLVKSLKSMFTKQEKQVLERFKNDPRPNVNLIDRTEAIDAFKKAVEKPLQDLLVSSVEDATSLIEKQSPATRYALAWLATRIGWAAEEIGDETERVLSEQLRQGFEAGEGMKVISRRIEGVYDGFRKNRALLISRTETIMAANEGALYGYEQSGVVEKVEFYTALDERTCNDCSSMHGQEFVLEESHGMIPLHPLCRCTWLPIV